MLKIVSSCVDKKKGAESAREEEGRGWMIKPDV